MFDFRIAVLVTHLSQQWLTSWFRICHESATTLLIQPSIQPGLLFSQCQFNYSFSVAGKTIRQSCVITLNCEILLLCSSRPATLHSALCQSRDYSVDEWNCGGIYFGCSQIVHFGWGKIKCDSTTLNSRTPHWTLFLSYSISPTIEMSIKCRLEDQKCLVLFTLVVLQFSSEVSGVERQRIFQCIFSVRVDHPIVPLWPSDCYWSEKGRKYKWARIHTVL